MFSLRDLGVRLRPVAVLFVQGGRKKPKDGTGAGIGAIGTRQALQAQERLLNKSNIP